MRTHLGATLLAAGLLAGGAVAAAGPGGLPTSTANPHRVQPQPAAGSCHARGQGLFALPDPRCTPGAIDPRVTQTSIGSTICRSGYTETVRPPESVTEAEKRASLRAYGDRRPPPLPLTGWRPTTSTSGKGRPGRIAQRLCRWSPTATTTAIP